MRSVSKSYRSLMCTILSVGFRLPVSLRLWLFLWLLSLTSSHLSLYSFSQNYPIYVTPSLTAPYSLKLSDYSMPGSQHLVVQIRVNDLNVSNLPVKLRIKMETAGVTIENPPTITTVPIYLNGGQVSILFGEDLADYFKINNFQFKGYSRDTYQRTGQLPEGYWKFTVEVLHFATHKVISNQGTATGWIAVGKPPILRTPLNQTEMGQYPGMPLVFTWLPSNVGVPLPQGSIRYTFEMWEMRVQGIDPYVVAASIPVFHTVTQQNTVLSLNPAELLLEPGMRYAWRVTAQDISGQVPFEQDGHSEIRTFDYLSRCDSIAGFTAVRRGRAGTFQWNTGSNHTSFNVELRNPATGWMKTGQNFDNKISFYELDYGNTYQIRVQAVCNGDPNSVSDFTAWHSLTIPAPKGNDTTACPGCRCEDKPLVQNFDNLNLRRDLKPGDTIVHPSGTTRFIVKTVVPQGDGVYKGIFLFWAEIWKAKIFCEYWDLSVNTDNVIVRMDYESIYNPQYLLDADAAKEYIDHVADAVADLTTNTNIKDTVKITQKIDGIYVDDKGQVIIVTDNGGTLTETPLDSRDFNRTLVQGADGEKYVVTGDGKVMGVDEFKNTGGNSRKMDDYKKEKEKKAAPSVDFTASAMQAYGFDTYNRQKENLTGEYPELKPGYRPAFKSIASFGTDRVKPSQTNGLNFRDEMGLPAMPAGEDLTLRGSSAGSVTAMYAYRKVNDSTEQIAGKLNVMSFDKQHKKVYMVPVNEPKKLPDYKTLENTLNRIYTQAVTSWEVSLLQGINVTFAGGNMTHGGSSALSVYNADQKAIIKAFGKMEKDALYLFFVDNVTGKTGDIGGYMPLQRQAGFIYDNPSDDLIAHELGHGAFNLRHTFSSDRFVAAQGATDNLMDYKDGTELWHHQWKLIQDPENVWLAALQDEAEGEMPCLGLFDDCRKVRTILEDIRNARLKRETVTILNGKNQVIEADGLNVNGVTYKRIRIISTEEQDITIWPFDYTLYNMTFAGQNGTDKQAGFAYYQGDKEIFKIIVDDDSKPLLPLQEYIYGDISISASDVTKYMEQIRNAYIGKRTKLKILCSNYTRGWTPDMISLTMDNTSGKETMEIEIPSQRPKAIVAPNNGNRRQHIFKSPDGGYLTITFDASKQRDIDKYLFPAGELLQSLLEGDGKLTREQANEIRDEYIEKITDPEKKAEAYFMLQEKVTLIDPENFKEIPIIVNGDTLQCIDAVDVIMQRHFEERGLEYKRPFESWSLATQDDASVYIQVECYQKAIEYLNLELGKGNPVMVGVDWKKGGGNYDKITDHWVVITARRQDEKGVYYTYMEVAHRNTIDRVEDIERGTSESINRFYFDEINNCLIGMNPTVNQRSGILPIVTVIRGETNDDCCKRSIYANDKLEPKENANRIQKEKAMGTFIMIHPNKMDYKQK